MNDDIYERSQAKRQERWKKDWAFKRYFYQKIDEMLECQTLKELQPGIEWLIAYCDQIDGKEIFQPMSGFMLHDLESFLHGLSSWSQIRKIINDNGLIKQVDIISQLNMDKNKAGFFLYTLDRMGVIKKEKQGRYNVYSYVSESINTHAMRQSWWLFDESKRLPIE